MSLPQWCDFCGQVLTPWDDREDCPCRSCGNIVKTWEHLDPDLRRLRMKMIARRLDPADELEVKKDVL